MAASNSKGRNLNQNSRRKPKDTKQDSSSRKGKQVELTEIPQSIPSVAWNLLRNSFVGKILLFFAGFAGMIGINILLAANQFDRFALILGIEVIVAALVAWIVYVLRNRDDIFNSGESQ